MSELVAGLDLGTSSAKLVVLAPDGTLVAEAQQDYPTHVAAGGVVEQDPQHWWDAAVAVLQRSGVADRVCALGLTGQMQDLVPVAGRRALRPAMLYSDTRAAAQHSRLTGAVTHWEHRTGNHQDASNVAAKIAWLAEHEPGALHAAEHLLLSPAGAVAHRAGGRAACDVLTASTTGLLDVTTSDWLSDAVEAAGAQPAQLPDLVGMREGDQHVGAVDVSAAAELGVAEGTPLVLAMGDAGATTAGLVGDRTGDAYLYLGTTGWLAAVTPAGVTDPSPIHSLVMPGWAQRLRIGAVQSAGSAAAWSLATFLPGMSFEQAEARVAGRLAHVDARPLCLPGLAGERTPVRNPDLRGTFIGAGGATTAEDFHLAVLTGVAMGLRHAADAMGIRQDRIALVGGAASSHAWRQILADVFGATIITGSSVAPGAHHAARAAADAVGLSHQLAPVFDHGQHTETRVSPVHERLAAQVAVHRGLYDALAPTFHRLADPRTGAAEG